MTDDDDPFHLSESDQALLDTVRMLMEILIITGHADVAGLDALLGDQQNEYLRVGKTGAAGLMQLLRLLAKGPGSEDYRNKVRALLELRNGDDQ